MRQNSNVVVLGGVANFFQEEIMTKFVSFIAIAAFALSASSAEVPPREESARSGG